MASAALTVDLNARIAQFEAEMKKAMGTLDKFGKRGDETANLLRTAFKSIGGAYIAKELVQFAKAGIDAADSLNDMSVRLGVTVKDLASLQLVAEQSGTSLEGIGVGLAKLNKSSSEAAGGNDKLAAALLGLGVTASTPLERFYQLADAVQGMEDPTKRAADLSAVLGKQYLDLVPTLVQGGDALRESAKASESFADAMAKLAPDADKFNDNLATLKLNASGAAAGLLGELVPAMNSVIEKARQAQMLGENGFNFIKLLGLGVVSTQAPAEQLKDVNSQIRITAKELSTMKGGVLDIFGDKTAMEGKLADLKRLRALLQNQVVTDIQTPAKSNRAPSGGDTGAQMACIAKGGSWSDGKCTPKKTGSKKKGFDVAGMHADDVSDGMKAANEEAEKLRANIEFSNEGLLETSNILAAQHQEWVEAGRAVTFEFLTPMQKAAFEVDRVQMLLAKGLISEETAVMARESIEIGLMEPLKETKSLAEEIGLTFTSAFEDAVAGGKSFSDVLKALEQDLIKLLMRKTVTEPLMKAIDGFDFSAIFSGMTANAKGGVYSSPSLSAYSGSIVSSPTLFAFAKGAGVMGEAGAEAILPLKRGANGKLGVEGGGGSSVQVNVINNANGTQASTQERQENGVRIIDVMVEQVEGAIGRRMSRGEGLAPTMERRYGLNPSAGAMR